MKPPEYKKLVEKRIDSLWKTIEKKLDFHNVTADRKKAIRQMFDDSAKPVWTEVAKVSSDGSVTREEALQIRALTQTLRSKLREKMASDKKARATPPTPPEDPKVKKPAAPKTPAEPTAPAKQPSTKADAKGETKADAKKAAKTKASTR